MQVDQVQVTTYEIDLDRHDRDRWGPTRWVLQLRNGARRSPGGRWCVGRPLRRLASIGRATARPGPAPGGVGLFMGSGNPARRRPARPGLARRASRGIGVSEGWGPDLANLVPRGRGSTSRCGTGTTPTSLTSLTLKGVRGFPGRLTNHDPRLTHGSPASRACTNAGGDLGAQRSQRSQGCYCARGRGTSNLLDPAPTCARSTPRLLVDGAPIGAVASR